MNRRMRSLHRGMGAVVALFVLMLAITGVLLNHTSDLELDDSYLTWGWLLEHYGINTVEPDAVYLLDTHVISQFDQQLFVDAKPTAQVQQAILGGVALENLLVLATKDALILLTPEGEFIEKIGVSAGIPPDIQNIGWFHGEPVIQTRFGIWRSDFMLEEWEQVSLQGVGWSVPQPMPELVAKKLATYFHGKGISIERFVLDLHNGHILNKYGVWMLDILAGLLIMLSLSGLWMWLRRR